MAVPVCIFFFLKTRLERQPLRKSSQMEAFQNGFRKSSDLESWPSVCLAVSTTAAAAITLQLALIVCESPHVRQD